jgi:hypothetical protein
MVLIITPVAADVYISVTFVAGGVVVGGVYLLVYFTVGNKVGWESIQEEPQSMFHYDGKKWGVAFPQLNLVEDTRGNLIPCTPILGIRF